MNKLNEQIYLRALDAAVSGIIITDNNQPDNPIIYCNSAFELLTGYDKKEIIGHNCRFLQAKDRNQSERMILRNAVIKGIDCVIEIRNYKKDGTLFFNELYMSPIKNNEGKIIYFIGVQNDISRRKYAELELYAQKDRMEDEVSERTKRLEENEHYLESIIQTIRESLIVLDKNFDVISVNDFFLKTFKVSREETINKRFYNLGNGQWNIIDFKMLLEHILPDNNPVVEYEVEHDFPFIGKKKMLINAFRIETESSFRDRILLAIEDVTIRREIEQRKDDFLSIASHELKTPLTVIKGYLQMLGKLIIPWKDSNISTIVAKTEQQTNRLTLLINELLDVSKIQSGKFEDFKSEINFDKVVKDAVENFINIGTTHSISVTGETKKTLFADETHIIQVLNNLISNAIKYSPKSTGIQVHLANLGEFIKCSVIDSGIGISLDNQSKLFARFFRVKDIQTSYSGMGIGLFVANQIIKNHNGTLWVESAEGSGSTFSFTLPTKVKNSN